MTFPTRTTAALTLLALAADARAQPVVPSRPRYSAYQNFFFPGSVMPYAPSGYPAPGTYGQYGPYGGSYARAGNVLLPLSAPGTAGPYGASPAGLNPFVAPGFVPLQPAVFNSLGHWYPGLTGYYGHWYPNGIAGGAGVLGTGGGFGVPLAGMAGGFRTGGTGLLGTMGSVAGIGAGIGALRR